MSSDEEPLTIGDVARATGLAASAVRYYESIGLIPPVPRESGWRRFDRAVLDRIALVQLATGLGFRLEEVKQLLDAMDEGGPNPMSDLAAAKVPELEARLADLQRTLAFMNAATQCDCATLQECAEAAPLLEVSPEGENRAISR